MKRLRDMDVADSVTVSVIAGPADLTTWEVSACVDTDGMTLYVTGRGTDLEAAAASAMAVLTMNGSILEATPIEDHRTSNQPLHPPATRAALPVVVNRLRGRSRVGRRPQTLGVDSA